MTEKEKILILSYLFNNEVRLSDEKRELQANVRNHEITEVDCVELIIASVRLETFKEVSKHIRQLINISDDKYDRFIKYLWEDLK